MILYRIEIVLVYFYRRCFSRHGLFFIFNPTLRDTNIRFTILASRAEWSISQPGTSHVSNIYRPFVLVCRTGDIMSSPLIGHTGDLCSLFNKRYAVLPPNIVKSRSREIGFYNDCIALKIDRYRESAVAEVPVTLNDWKCFNPNLAASGLYEILW